MTDIGGSRPFAERAPIFHDRRMSCNRQPCDVASGACGRDELRPLEARDAPHDRLSGRDVRGREHRDRRTGLERRLTDASPNPPAEPPTEPRRARSAALAQRLEDLNRRSETLPGGRLVRETLRNERRLGGALLAGGVAFRMFLWLTPLGLVFAAVLSLWSETDPDGLESAAKKLGVGAAAAHAGEPGARGGRPQHRGDARRRHRAHGLVHARCAPRADPLLRAGLAGRAAAHPPAACARSRPSTRCSCSASPATSASRGCTSGSVPRASSASLVSLVLVTGIALLAMWLLPHRCGPDAGSAAGRLPRRRRPPARPDRGAPLLRAEARRLGGDGRRVRRRRDDARLALRAEPADHGRGVPQRDDPRPPRRRSEDAGRGGGRSPLPESGACPRPGCCSGRRSCCPTRAPRRCPAAGRCPCCR